MASFDACGNKALTLTVVLNNPTESVDTTRRRDQDAVINGTLNNLGTRNIIFLVR
jgi:hypothetical protein